MEQIYLKNAEVFLQVHPNLKIALVLLGLFLMESQKLLMSYAIMKVKLISGLNIWKKLLIILRKKNLLDLLKSLRKRNIKLIK